MLILILLSKNDITKVKLFFIMFFITQKIKKKDLDEK